MVSVFDDESARFVVLANDRDERSIWPALLAVPEGWRVLSDPGSRTGCLSEIGATWSVDAGYRGRAADDQ